MGEGDGGGVEGGDERGVGRGRVFFMDVILNNQR